MVRLSHSHPACGWPTGDRGMFFPFLQVVELVSNSASARSLKQQNVCSTADEYRTRTVVPGMLDSQKALEHIARQRITNMLWRFHRIRCRRADFDISNLLSVSGTPTIDVTLTFFGVSILALSALISVIIL